ncbi:MAG TPA: hypothetical protein VKI19_01875 [Acidimicrobiales bacterium]|nr:hypothetical protein [Acidimicrobiales bacterium]
MDGGDRSGHEEQNEQEDPEEDIRPLSVDHVDGALLISFGAVHLGREALAVDQFTGLSRYLGRVLAEGAISGFRPYFFADGRSGDVVGFFLLEGKRSRLDVLRREEDFIRHVLEAGAATANVRVQTLIAGSEAGRLVNLYREVGQDLGLIPPPGEAKQVDDRARG